MSSKFNMLYYKALLDQCFIRFFDENGESFSKENGSYVLSRTFSKVQIEKMFKNYLSDELKKYIAPYDRISQNFYFIIGACKPKDNILLKFKDGYFPAKLTKIIDSQSNYKYLLKEHDIKIDLVRFNEAFIDLFNNLFKDRREVERVLGKKYKNVIFIQHKQLDCYTMFKVIKHIYGRSNCWNIHKEKFYNLKSPLIAINDLIDRYVKNRLALNKSKEFKTIIEEVKSFLAEKINEVSLNG